LWIGEVYIRGDIIEDDSAALRLIRSAPPLKQTYDVIVVGAGPAGSTLACELAGRGIRVLLLEKEKFPRYKCCAGGVTSKTAKLLTFDISEVVEEVIHKISFTFNLCGPYLGQHSQPLIYTVMRNAFDHFVVQKAQQVGTAFMDGQKVTQIQESGDWVDIHTGHNIFRSRLVVGADGASSIVARQLGLSRDIRYLAAVESEVVVPAEELSKWKSRIQIELGCIPQGYAWVFPKRDHLSIGAGCLGSRAKHLKYSHQKFLESLGIGSYAVARSSSHLIPTRTRGRLVWQDKALLLGDAAGLADPLTGEGIHNAILSARLAAPVIEGSLVRSKVGLQDYQETVESRIMSEMKMARTLSKFFVRFPHLAFGLLNQSDSVWRVLRDLMLGEIGYADIKGEVGIFKALFLRLLGI
jgi:geranylgeranyl reductase family protein